MRTRLAFLTSGAILGALLCVSAPANAQPRPEQLLTLAKGLPQSRRLSSWVGKQCQPLREARDAARALGAWDAARAREFAWGTVQQSLDALEHELPPPAAAAADISGADDAAADAAHDATVATEAAANAAIEQRRAQLRELAASIDVVVTACDAVAAGNVTSE